MLIQSTSKEIIDVIYERSQTVNGFNTFGIRTANRLVMDNNNNLCDKLQLRYGRNHCCNGLRLAPPS